MRDVQKWMRYQTVDGLSCIFKVPQTNLSCTLWPQPGSLAWRGNNAALQVLNRSSGAVESLEMAVPPFFWATAAQCSSSWMAVLKVEAVLLFSPLQSACQTCQEQGWGSLRILAPFRLAFAGLYLGRTHGIIAPLSRGLCLCALGLCHEWMFYGCLKNHQLRYQQKYRSESSSKLFARFTLLFTTW